MAAPPPAAVLSARDTIQFTIRILRSYGIDNLTPETIRQAKFNAPAVSPNTTAATRSQRPEPNLC